MMNRDGSLDRSLEDLVHVGRIWTLHGLAMGQSALAASAETLRTTSALLAAVARAVEAPRASTEADPSSNGTPSAG